MKVSKNVSIDIELLNKVIAKEIKFSKAVEEALQDWLQKNIPQVRPNVNPKKEA